MRLSTILIILFAVVMLMIASGIFAIKRPKKLKTDRFIASWKELQGFCRDKTTWPMAITQADKLLDAALKKRKLKGKSMGARMVSAQRLFTSNDNTWFAHNLAKKLSSGVDVNLKESEVKDALLGFRQALRDIGALPASGKEVADDK